MFRLLVASQARLLMLSHNPQYPKGNAGAGRSPFTPYAPPRRGTGPVSGAVPSGSVAGAKLSPPVAGARLDPAAPWSENVPAAGPGAGRTLAALDHGRTMLDGLQEIMGLLYRGGQKDGAQYQELSEQYKKLSARYKQGKEAIAATAQTAAADRASSFQPVAVDVPLITGCLGSRGRPSVVSLGAPVRALQQLLAALGLKVAVTGEYDGPTTAAVLEFQARMGLAANGIVGSETRAALNGLRQGG